MKKLFIDTTERSETKVKLKFEKKEDVLSENSKPKSQNTLILIEKILKKNKINPTDLDQIEVNEGPGSFTGTRVGVAIANALGFALKIKVNKKKQAIPRYN